MKKIFLLFLITFILLSTPGNIYAEEKEQWEKDLTTCINQKKQHRSTLQLIHQDLQGLPTLKD